MCIFSVLLVRRYEVGARNTYIISATTVLTTTVVVGTGS